MWRFLGRAHNGCSNHIGVVFPGVRPGSSHTPSCKKNDARSFLIKFVIILTLRAVYSRAGRSLRSASALKSALKFVVTQVASRLWIRHSFEWRVKRI